MIKSCRLGTSRGLTYYRGKKTRASHSGRRARNTRACQPRSQWRSLSTLSPANSNRKLRSDSTPANRRIKNRIQSQSRKTGGSIRPQPWEKPKVRSWTCLSPRCRPSTSSRVMDRPRMTKNRTTKRKTYSTRTISVTRKSTSTGITSSTWSTGHSVPKKISRISWRATRNGHRWKITSRLI